MKKIIALFLIFSVLYSCNSDDNGNSSSSLNPPEWIQGRWLESGGMSGFHFKTNDFCSITFSSEMCYVELFNSLPNQQQVIFEETIKNNDVYEFNYKTTGMGAGQTVFYRFERISNSKILYINPIMPEGTEYYKN